MNDFILIEEDNFNFEKFLIAKGAKVISRKTFSEDDGDFDGKYVLFNLSFHLQGDAELAIFFLNDTNEVLVAYTGMVPSSGIFATQLIAHLAP